MAKIVNTEEFNQIINEGVVIVDFYADWCGPCKMVAPIFDELSNELSEHATFIKVNVDDNQELAQKYDVHTIPTIIIVKLGEEKDRVVGFLPKDQFKESILKYL